MAPPGGGVGDEDAVGDGGDEGVALGGETGGGAALVVGEGGKDEEAAHGKRSLPRGGEAHGGDAAGGADDDGLGAAKKEVEALALHRGVEAADNGNPSVAEGAGKVVGAKNQVAGALDRAEEGEQGSGQDGLVADQGGAWR